MTKSHKIILLLVAFLLSFSVYAKKSVSIPKIVVPQKSSSTVITNHWYTMQAGSTPWGYFHEVIEKKENRYFYRYEMSKRENGSLYQETLGAVSEEDLTPIAFNLTKSGEGATEVINGSYTKDGGTSPFILVDVSGGRKFQVKRHLNKNAIFEVMFPIYLAKQWSQFKPGFKGTATVFTEEQVNSDFITRQVRYTVKGKAQNVDCTEIEIEMDNTKSLWCMNQDGIVHSMNINNNQVQVMIAKNEDQAKAFLDNSAKPVKTTEINKQPLKKKGN